MDLDYMQQNAHENSKVHGFWDENQDIPTRLMLIVTEVAEAMEEYREDGGDIKRTRFREDGKPEGFPSELADIIIRVGDLAEFLGISLSKEIELKHAFNQTRERLHGKVI
jgi:NTP pyrophosphatase (non-canonical NTP hydrolase)